MILMHRTASSHLGQHAERPRENRLQWFLFDRVRKENAILDVFRFRQFTAQNPSSPQPSSVLTPSSHKSPSNEQNNDSQMKQDDTG